MKNSALIWIFIVGIVIAVLFAFNYQGNKNVIPLSEIFPEEKTFPVDVEYEFVDQQGATQEPATTSAAAPADDVAQTTPAESAKTEAIPTAPASVKEDLALSTAQKIPFTIQIASFKTKEAAQSSLTKVLEKGYKGYIVSRNLGEQGTWHRVYVGIYQDKTQAQQELTQVQKDYPSSFVISPK